MIDRIFKRIRRPEQVPGPVPQPMEASDQTVEMRLDVVAALTAEMKRLILDERNVFTADVEEGMDLDVGKDGITTTVKRNGTCTILVTINGGAQGTLYPKAGSRIVPSE